MRVRAMTNQTTQKKSPGGQLSLWHVLTVTAGGVALANSWVAAKMAGIGKAHTLAALFFGLVIAALLVWAIRSIGAAFTLRFRLNDPAETATRSVIIAIRLLYVGAAAWIVVSGVIGYQTTARFIALLGL